MRTLEMEEAHGPATSEGRVGGSAVVLCAERSLTGAGRSRSCQRPRPTQASFGAMSSHGGRQTLRLRFALLFQGVINIDSKVADRALELGVSEKELHRP